MGRFVPAAPECSKTRDRRWKIDTIVIHVAEGTEAGTIAWFQKSGRSVPTATHFVVGLGGTVTQMVLESRKALHCGSKTEAGWNDRSIGLELATYVTATEWPEPMLVAAAELVADICQRRLLIKPDRKHIIGHSEIPGVDHTDPGPNFPWDRFMALVLEAYTDQGVDASPTS